MSKKSTLTVKVPGKLFIAGEYAVTRPGGLALVAGIETGFAVQISESKGLSHFKTNAWQGEFEFDLNSMNIQTPAPWNLAYRALVNFAESYLKSPIAQINLDIKSDLGFGEEKKGYGSSASVVVGLVEVLNDFFQTSLSMEQIFELAARTHFDVQGSGSMGDVAAISSGGIILYRNHDLIQPVDFPWEVYVAQTGQAVKTAEKLGLQFSEAFYEKSDELVGKLAVSQDFQTFKQLLSENQELLRKNLPKEYVTEKLNFALKAINSHPRLAGKISGAGFGENLIIFSNGVSQGEIELLRQSLAQHEIKMEGLKIANRKSKY